MFFVADQMALYFPIGGAAYNEALNMMPVNNIYLPSNGELAFEFKEDLVLGLYKLSLTPEGRDKILSYIPEHVRKYILQYFDGSIPLTGNSQSDMFSVLLDKLDNIQFGRMLNSLAKLSHTEADVSVSLVDYVKAKQNENDLNNPVSLMVQAGARGKWSQVKQINETRGFISDVEGRIIPSAISSSLMHGLTPKEYFTSAYGGLKGLIDSARNTALSGYLTRRIVYLVSNNTLSSKVRDCGTKHFITLSLTKKNVGMYLYRVVKLDPEDATEYIITKDNQNFFVDKTVD
jgi:DNA-directed RNA polymerase beta' subunit